MLGCQSIGANAVRRLVQAGTTWWLNARGTHAHETPFDTFGTHGHLPVPHPLALSASPSNPYTSVYEILHENGTLNIVFVRSALG
jgi:hypothetical protein